MFSIYIHIPFCLRKCPYCDFHSVATQPEDIPQKEYADAVCAELEQQATRHNLRGKTVDTVYFGGGTPTIFKPKYIEQILNHLSATFKLSSEIEISIEANPETIIPSPSPFNRISIGIQTFDDLHLKNLGRIHSSQTARDAIRFVQDAGFKNINIDLMWGLPNQTTKELEDDLDSAIKFSPQHISAYQLTLAASATLPDEELAREMFLLVHDKLTCAGYEHYEISNFAKIPPFPPLYKGGVVGDFRCRHNLNYWHYGQWLGIGCSASSNLVCHCESARGGRSNPVNKSERAGLIWLTPRNDAQLLRLTSIKNINQYLRRNFTYETEIIDKKTAMAEYCFLGLRTSDGINMADFKSRFGMEFDDVYPGLWVKWQKQGLTKILKYENTKILNLSGWLISNELFAQLII